MPKKAIYILSLFFDPHTSFEYPTMPYDVMALPPINPVLGVIPPYIGGDPTDPGFMTPYHTSMEEVCASLGTSDARREILRGLLDLRQRLRQAGVEGFQWLGGSFMEDCIVTRRREPNDIDVVTYVGTPNTPREVDAATTGMDHDSVKRDHRVDHYLVPLSSPTIMVVDECRYWCGLFSHRREDGLWKGMANVKLTIAGNDDAARQTLEGN